MLYQIPLCAAAALLLMTGAAFAEDETAAKKEGHHGRPGMMEKIDANGDGTVTVEESAAASNKQFDELDKDKDGVITAADMEARMKEMEARHEEKMKEKAAEGVVPPANDERRQKMHDGMMKRFSAMDADGDGKVTREQFAEQGEKKFSEIDKDGNGSVSNEERQAYRAAKKAEWKEKREQFRKMKEQQAGEQAPAAPETPKQP